MVLCSFKSKNNTILIEDSIVQVDRVQSVFKIRGGGVNTNHKLEKHIFYDNKYLKSELKKKIKRIKQKGGTLLIKIDSHPCAGKTFFIKRHKNMYRGLKLYDFDNYKGEDRTSKLLLNKTEKSVLFGTFNNDSHEDIVSCYVFPTLKILFRNIKERKKKKQSFWSDPVNVLNNREYFLTHFRHQPIFKSFSEALDFIINTFESNS